MFGLMRAKKCGMSEDEKHFRRLNYCGTCKTIGSLYGQKSRLLLNHDTVFLAEILSALSTDAPKDWARAYQSYNCLSRPKAEMPAALRFAATTNVILAEFKLADHAADEKKRRYRLAHNAFSREFRQAEKLLTEWDFPLAEVRAVLNSQERREKTERSLDALAFPTAETTAVFFREGVRLIGRRELGEEAFGLGFAFGKLVYLIDAFEDYEKDFRGGQFNALRAAFALDEEKLTPEAKRKTAAILHEIERAIVEKIDALPLPANQKTLFVSRLSQNLAGKLKAALPVLKTNRVCAVRPRPTFRQRWRNASEKAQNLARSYGWQMPLVFLFVFAFALVAPAQTREAKSARECFELSFNLIALGAIFGAVLAFPKTILAMTPEQIAAEEARKKARQQDGSGDSGDAGGEAAEGCCDCCCECDRCDCSGCNCGSCCDNCDCCSGCCGNCGCDGCCDCSCD